MEKSLVEKLALVGRCYTILVSCSVAGLVIETEPGSIPIWKLIVSPIIGRYDPPSSFVSLPIVETTMRLYDEDQKVSDPTIMVDEALRGIYRACVERINHLLRIEKVIASRDYLERTLRELEKSIVG